MGRASRLPHSCEPWAMFAMPFPENLADAAMAEAERMANDPMPGSKCPARIIALEREIEELSRVEEALVEAAIARIERRSHWAVDRDQQPRPAAASSPGTAGIPHSALLRVSVGFRHQRICRRIRPWQLRVPKAVIGPSLDHLRACSLRRAVRQRSCGPSRWRDNIAWAPQD